MSQVTAEQTSTSRGTFIAWHAFSRRGQLLSEKLELELYLIHMLKRRYFLAPVRYVLQAARTLAVLVREKPRLVFVQNPPIFAVIVVYLYAKLWKARYVIDSHTGGLLAPWWQWSLPIHAFLSRRAITTIVTNEHLSALVESWGARSFIVGDVPTTFPQGKPFSLNGKFSIAVINTFSPDEPLAEILEAAATLPEVEFYITGNTLRAKRSFFESKPDNVRFTGFLPDEEYYGLLRAVQAVMVLTTDNHTMQRGACEAVSLGKPVITSSWPILREYFNKGTIHVDNSAESIREAVIRMQREQETLEDEILVLQQDRRHEWQEKQVQLVRIIEEGGSPGGG